MEARWGCCHTLCYRFETGLAIPSDFLSLPPSSEHCCLKHTCPSFYLVPVDLNSDPQTCTASTVNYWAISTVSSILKGWISCKFRLVLDSLYSWGCSWTLDLPAFPSWVLGLQLCTTTLGLRTAGDRLGLYGCWANTTKFDCFLKLIRHFSLGCLLSSLYWPSACGAYHDV